MLRVQIWELSLAMMKLVAGPTFGRPQPLTERRILQQLRRMIHTFQNASAAELLNDVEGELDDELREQLAHAIKWRNVLAHRYLRERVRHSESYTFKPGTAKELCKLGVMYDELGEALASQWKQRIANVARESPETVPPGWEAAWSGAARSVFLGSAYSEDDEEQLRRTLHPDDG